MNDNLHIYFGEIVFNTLKLFNSLPTDPGVKTLVLDTSGHSVIPYLNSGQVIPQAMMKRAFPSSFLRVIISKSLFEEILILFSYFLTLL